MSTLRNAMARGKQYLRMHFSELSVSECYIAVLSDEVLRLRKQAEAKDQRIAELIEENDRLDEEWGAECAARLTERKTLMRRIAEIEREDQSHANTIEQRDRAEKWADKLAYAIGEHFGVDVGEHSNCNCPWEAAFDAIPEDTRKDD